MSSFMPLCTLMCVSWSSESNRAAASAHSAEFGEPAAAGADGEGGEGEGAPPDAVPLLEPHATVSSARPPTITASRHRAGLDTVPGVITLPACWLPGRRRITRNGAFRPVITPAGNLDPAVWTRLATGQPLPLPDHGLGVLNHVHADDVAQAFERAVARPAAAGASFHVVAAQAMTLRGLATGVAHWFGREPVLEFVDWAEFGRQAGPEHAEATREHTFRGIAASIDRARQVLGYSPRFSSLEALFEALAWLVADGQVDVGGQQFHLAN